MEYILAVDSGGTKTDAMLATMDGNVIGWGHCDFRHPMSGRGPGGSGRSLSSVSVAVKAALGEDFQSTLLHLAIGCSIFPLEMLAHYGANRVEIHPVYEEAPAFTLAGADAGVMVVAGTGALVCVRCPDGRQVKLDGLGPLLGDYGSGSHIGLLAVRAAAKAAWHPRHATTLAEVVPRMLAEKSGKGDSFSLVRFMLEERDRTDLASLAEVVDREAVAGDRIAGEILDEAAGAIAETIRDGLARAALPAGSYPLIGSGSVAMKSDRYWRTLCARVAEFAPYLQPTRLSVPPVMGMALAVLQQMGVHPAEVLRRRLIDSSRVLLARAPAEAGVVGGNGQKPG